MNVGEFIAKWRKVQLGDDEVPSRLLDLNLARSGAKDAQPHPPNR